MENICYHGIGENLLRYASIMQNGIVSAQRAEGIALYSNNGEGHYNGNNNISVAIPHEGEYGSLRIYILNGGISFKIKDKPYIMSSATSHNSGFFDEGFVYDSISLDEIDSIIVNNSIREKRISELSALGHSAYGRTIDIATMLMEYLVAQGIETSKFNGIQELFQSYSDVLDNESINGLERDKKIEQIRTNIDNLISKAIEQFYRNELGKDSISVMDIIEYYNRGRYPIYDENEVRETCKGRNFPQPPPPTHNLFHHIHIRRIGKFTVDVSTHAKIAARDVENNENVRTATPKKREK